MNYLSVLLISLSIFITEKRNDLKKITIGSYCDLHGSVCIVDNPQQANYKVFIEDAEAFADIMVFETDNSLYADKPGVWYFVENKGFADFTIYVVDSKEKADFSVFYTSMESMAGCNN